MTHRDMIVFGPQKKSKRSVMLAVAGGVVFFILLYLNFFFK